MKIYAAREPAEVVIEATAVEIMSLYHLYGSDRTEIKSLGSGDAHPYDEILTSINLKQSRGNNPVLLSIAWGEKAFYIDGGGEKLEVFFLNIFDIAKDAAPGTHHHIEYHEDHYFLDPKSISLIIKLRGD